MTETTTDGDQRIGETTPENPQSDELMNDDVSIEAFEKNAQDKEIAKLSMEMVNQISTELREAMVNDCAEKLVAPKVIAVHYQLTHNKRVKNVNNLKKSIFKWVKLSGKMLPEKFEITTYEHYKRLGYGQWERMERKRKISEETGNLLRGNVIWSETNMTTVILKYFGTSFLWRFLPKSDTFKGFLLTF